jgi:hypothetical protein
METFKATIIRGDQSTVLALQLGETRYDITLTDDNPNDVKSVFNKLLQKLKDGQYSFELDDTTEDLYYYICKEYISQLNSELSSVYKELEDYELLSHE